MKTILVVDDQPAVRELIGVILEIGPYRVLTAENGDQALEMARAESPDLILLDVMMTGGKQEGLAVCRLLKADVHTRNIYIVLLTAKGQNWDKEARYAAGADDYFVKPFSPLELMNKVGEVLGK